MSELDRMRHADIVRPLDSLNRNEGNMTQEESGAALPEQLQEVLRSIGELPNDSPLAARALGNAARYTVNSDVGLPTPEELRRQLHEEGEQ